MGHFCPWSRYSSIWFKQIRDFKKQYNVLLLDLRGHGDSKTTLKRLSNRNIFRSCFNDILEVLDFLEIKNHTLLGFH
jgi:pimeloyl-ACP methyl ester carboxylesterase